MKQFLLISAFAFTGIIANAQTDVAEAHKQATDLAQQGKFDDAINIVTKAYANNQGNTQLLKDKAYFSYMKGDYKAAIEAGKILIDKPDVDEQSYQILGSALNANHNAKESENVYRTGIGKFPKSSVLYSELGVVLLQSNQKEAIKTWEQGIQVDPNVSNNYYYLAKLYAQGNNNSLWAALYGEIFVNMETYTERTKEIKALVYDQYKALFISPVGLDKYLKGAPFEKAVADVLKSVKYSLGTADIGVESLIALRIRFILGWYEAKNNLVYPFRLFDRQLQLLKMGTFDVYNRWLFSSDNEDAFRVWAQAHEGEAKEFQNFHQSVLFKIPAGEYYAH
jgi:tetratricopeptide (TPR) repeat protein